MTKTAARMGALVRARFASALPLISASQISTFRDCARKWAWRYIAKIESPTHPSAVLGTEVHDTQLGPYLLEGREFDFTRDSGYIAASLLAFLPKPKTRGLEVEKHFVLPSPASGGKFAYQGYEDLYLPDSGLVPGMPGGAPFVGDFKTTGDLKWAKNEKALSVDVQAMLYATNAIYETRADKVDLAWMYAQTKGPRKSKRTYLRVTADHVVEQFKAIEDTAVELFSVRAASQDRPAEEFVLSLRPTPGSCEAYGGCPYRAKCNLSPVDYIAALGAWTLSGKEIEMGSGSEGGTSSLLANLKARKAGAQGAGGLVPTPGMSGPIPDSASPAPAPSAPPEPALGINPPEKDLPAPPPTVAKRGPGRPKKEVPAAEPAADPRQVTIDEHIAAKASPPVVIDYDKLAVLIVDQLATALARGRGVC